jgi:type IV pilus assembly protein PilQ
MKKSTISKLCINTIILMFLFGCATSSGTKELSSVEDIPVITDIAIQDNKVIIKSNSGFTYTAYNAGDPYKTTVEIPGMSVGKYTSKIVPGVLGVAEVLPQQISSPTLSAKIDIMLRAPSSVSPLYANNTLVLLVKQEQSATETDSGTVPTEAESIPADSPVVKTPVFSRSINTAEDGAEPLSKATDITGIKVQQDQDGVYVLITGNGGMKPNVFPLEGRIVVDIPGVELKTALPGNVIAPVKGIRAGKHKDKLRLVLDMKGKTDFDVTSAGKSVEIAFSQKGKALSAQGRSTSEKTFEAVPVPAVLSIPAATLQTAAPELDPLIEGEYNGKKISLDFQDADIIPIFRLLGDISGYNVVVNPAVKGTITLKLINVPWDQAMDIILRTFSLSRIVDGNIIRIVPTAIVAKELDEITRANKAKEESGDLETRIFPVNYADLAKLKDAIDKAKVLSSRGTLTLDERGSSLIVNDLKVNLARIQALIEEIDRPDMQARQVLIEAKIVEVNSDYTKDLGIQWGGNYLKATPSDAFTVGGTGQVGSAPSGNNFLINLPAAVSQGAGGAIGFGYINRAANLALDLQLSAMEGKSMGKVLSNPRIMTMNNQSAKITQGQTIYVPVATSDKADYKAIDALLSLDVKPRIAPGGAIFMDLNITKDQPGAITAGGINVLKNTIQTSVLVNNGDTIVIGGIFKTDNSEAQSGVPGISNVPVLGLLFKTKKDVSTTSEVLIFITPKVVEFSSLK